MRRLLLYLGVGFLIAYFFAPGKGRRRRALIRERIPALFFASGRLGEAGRAAAAEARALRERARELAEA